ncbi:hypothetical protein NDU88_001006 [Pleurodeles waltl]|uniref:Uncharacterized protein n=1 Tax=Pleurodeles waltl TaxID=8319 RepID=A0AAV7TIH1_PLEWA|nr:hypothetical protein NDU88_001006 [Pleurodeles waltl]
MHTGSVAFAANGIEWRALVFRAPPDRHPAAEATRNRRVCVPNSENVLLGDGRHLESTDGEKSRGLSGGAGKV